MFLTKQKMETGQLSMLMNLGKEPRFPQRLD